jgi:TonB family protein
VNMRNLLTASLLCGIAITLSAQLSVAPLPRPVQVSSGVMTGMLLEKTNPVYPPIAKAAHISGTVVLQATISKTGTIENLRVISGPAMLQQASLEAVKSWRYRPYLLMGEPVDVQTTINVIFTLGGSKPPSKTDVSEDTDPPQSQSAADGPSLAATMQFIQDKMNGQGKINYELHTHDNASGEDWPVYQISIEATNVVADPSTCRITWHKVTTNGGKVGINDIFSLDLRNVLTFEVRTSTHEAKMEDTANGHPDLDKRQDPPYFAVTAKLRDNTETPLFFSSEEMSNRIAKAMVHAVELCGGGKAPEPF